MPLPPDPAGGAGVAAAYSQARERMATCSSSGGLAIWRLAGGGSGGGEPEQLHAETVRGSGLC